jgi:hypothetical protein
MGLSIVASGWGSNNLIVYLITEYNMKSIMATIKTTSLDKLQVPDKQQKPTVITEDKSPTS